MIRERIKGDKGKSKYSLLLEKKTTTMKYLKLHKFFQNHLHHHYATIILYVCYALIL